MLTIELIVSDIRSLARPSVGHVRSRTQIIPIYVIGAGSDEIGEAVQNGRERSR
jgi:hypothetical protein